MSHIYFTEVIPHNGMVVIYGDLGKRQYMGYTEKQAQRFYLKEYFNKGVL